MSGRVRKYDALFEDPLARFSDERDEVLASGDRRRYEAFRSRDRAFLKFLDELEAIYAAKDPAALLNPLRGELARNFLKVSVVRVGKWSAYYELDIHGKWIVGLVITFGTVSANHLSTALRKARRRSAPKPPSKKPAATS